MKQLPRPALCAISVCAFVLGASSFALAQAPQTKTAELKALVGQMVRLANEIGTAKKKDEMFHDAAVRILALKEKHNASQPTCTTDDMAPCQAYDAEQAQIVKAMQDTHDAWIANDANLFELRRKLSLDRMEIVKIRLADFLEPFRQWRDRVVACSNKSEGAAMESCMNEAWNAYP